MDVVIKSFNGIGDLLFVTPTLQRIKEAYPKAKVIVNTNYPQLLDGNPFVDVVGTRKEGVFLGYPDPIHAKWPEKHHIVSDWEIVSKAYGLELEPPELKPQIYLKGLPERRSDVVGVQVIHKGHWHAKKVWPKFHELVRTDPDYLRPIPKVRTVVDLVRLIAGYKAVVCAEGGISHIAKAVGTPAIVIYGGFAKPEWNGYEDQINVCNEKWCSYCYDPRPCRNDIEKLCMKEITVEQVLRLVEGLNKIAELTRGNAKQFIEQDALRWCKGKGVDVGAGRWPLKGARQIDEGPEEDAYCIGEPDSSLDFVFSSHCLEHLDSPTLALKEWARILKPGGVLYLYLPHPYYVPWRKESMPKWHKHNFYMKDVVRMVGDVGFEVIETVERDWWFGQKIIARRRG